MTTNDDTNIQVCWNFVSYNSAFRTNNCYHWAESGDAPEKIRKKFVLKKHHTVDKASSKC